MNTRSLKPKAVKINSTLVDPSAELNLRLFLLISQVGIFVLYCVEKQQEISSLAYWWLIYQQC